MTIDDTRARFTEIYNRESDALFRFCLVRVSDREKALDLVQETFTRLWVHMAEGRGAEQPRAFLYVVMRHLIIDWYRRSKSVVFSALDREDHAFDAPDEARFGEIERNADANYVLGMLNRIHPHYREVIYLRFIEDLPPRDIAQMLKLSPNVVSIRITRGLEALRKELGINPNV